MAFIVLSLSIFGIAKASKPKEKPLIFVVDENLSKPLILYRPYASEFKKLPPKVTRKVQPKIQNKTANKRPQQSQSTPRSNQESYGAGKVQDLIRKYAQLYGINSNTALCIAQKESGFNPLSANKHSTARGVFQYLAGTWIETDEGKAGLSVYDPDANIKAAIKYMASRKSTSPWISTAKNCPPLSFL